MSPTDVIDLAILGVLSEGPASVTTLTRVIKQLGQPRFAPTSEVVMNRIERLCAQGRIEATPDTFDELMVTERGRAAVADLLRGAAPSPAETLGAVCQTLRVCLLDMVAPEARGDIVDDMIQAHRLERDRAVRALACCPCRCRLVQRYLARDVERWETEISWLEAIADDVVPERT
jgi:DNA-binding PadR family transcriptional regulator